MNNINQKGFTPIVAVLIVVGILVIAGGIYYFVNQKLNQPAQIISPETLEQAKKDIKNAKDETKLDFPKQCFLPKDPNLKPRLVRPKPYFFEKDGNFYLKNVDGFPDTKLDPKDYDFTSLTIKFTQGTGVRLRGGRFISLNPGCDLSEFNNKLERYSIVNISRLFTRPEEDLERDKISGEKNSGEELGDLNLYYVITTKTASDAFQLAIFLNSLEIIEDAGFYPIPKPAISKTSNPINYLLNKLLRFKAPKSASRQIIYLLCVQTYGTE